MLENRNWDYFNLDGFNWTHLIEFLGIPHYTNKNEGDKPPLLFEIRTIKIQDYPEQFLVIWRPETERPTDNEILAEESKVS